MDNNQMDNNQMDFLEALIDPDWNPPSDFDNSSSDSGGSSSDEWTSDSDDELMDPNWPSMKLESLDDSEESDDEPPMFFDLPPTHVKVEQSSTDFEVEVIEPIKVEPPIVYLTSDSDDSDIEMIN